METIDIFTDGSTLNNQQAGKELEEPVSFLEMMILEIYQCL